ncbi:ankyrin repeat-containing domain protein [Lophiotrema nucula]|uniref:Ankyrin repeat-containing domain protein n=1 Tax=Lophiotrema nucula TaxID=690887 RepID=A0A6A5YFB4_9PLEO|nr:ankyrin repeat-containing domain protein [Lophiotrema nucula]
MSRPNSRSANRFSDAQHQRRIQLQIDLLRAIKDKEDEHLRRFFGDAIKGPDALDSEGFYVILLRTIEKGHASAVEYLLRNGASPAQQRIKSRPLTSPLIRAVTSKNPNLDIVSLLLEYGDESMIDAADDQGRTAIMLAALSGNSKIVSRLIDFGADVNTLETQGRNVLHLVAAKICTLSTQEDLNILRTLWNSRLNFFAQDNLGRNPLHWACANGKHELVDELAQKYRADTTTDRRGKTYLHLAIAHGHTDVLRALINRQFDVHAKSHGGWTALHSASATGNLDAVILLTSAKVDVDARLRHGSTPLHLAAKKGYHAIVEHLLSHSAQPASKDNFGRTPFLLAAEGQHTSILACLFTKARPERESEAERACRNNSITMLNFGEYELDKDNIVHHFSLYDVLYKRDPQSRQTPPFRITPPPHRRTRVRWLHLPANNIEWVEALFDKIYLEEGSMTIESYRVLQKSLHDYRKALLDHSPFVGPLCYGTEGAATKVSLGNPDDDKPLPYRPFHLAMPYLHYETNSGRRQMQEALREIENRKGPSRVPTTEGDKLLLSGYSNTSPRPIQLRRTLDQFYLRGVDTEHRDIDQVVYRYQIASGNKDPRIYMVDELWMWLVTEDLIVTCFPRRWEQSEDDELDVLGGLISEINSGLLGELQSVHEVAQLITRRCIGTFDRHSPDPAYHFFQMFRASIDKAIDQEAQVRTFESISGCPSLYCSVPA